MDFSYSAQRLEKEQAQRREEARKKAIAEKQAIARQRQRETDAAIRRAESVLEQERIADEDRQNKEREIALTGGVDFERSFLAFGNGDLEEDRICLPASALSTLSSQDAFSKGVMLFSISRMNEQGEIISTTHCGVREFSAAEDTCVLSVQP